MSDSETVLTNSIGFAPSELVALYERGELPFYPDSAIHCLSLEEACDFNAQLSHVYLYDSLGLWFLDDANDSNPYAFISKGPCAGTILHYMHDDDRTIKFWSLASFMTRLHEAGKRGLFIDEIESEIVSLQLDNALFEIAGEDVEETPELVGVYLSACELLSTPTLERLSQFPDFYVREFLANYIAARPKEHYRSFAEALAKDEQFQVMEAGKKALSRIRQRRTQ